MQGREGWCRALSGSWGASVWEGQVSVENFFEGAGGVVFFGEHSGMRIIHTSDWHLGHTLHDQSREAEHAAFLEWLLERLEAEKVDALIVAGDIFDTSNPPASAQTMLYRFIADARRRLPALDMVIVGGNHDSPHRLDAPHTLLAQLGVRVVGGYAHADVDRMVVPLTGPDGQVAAWVAAVPYFRPRECQGGDDESAEALVEGARRLYDRVLEAARARRGEGQALIATGHCYMTGGVLSETSERKIQVGNQHALPVELFPDDIDYVALGHLHKKQMVGGRSHVRYSGSPLPLALDEAPYEHGVWRVDFADGRLADVQPLLVPRHVGIVRVPKSGAAPLDEVCAALRALPAKTDGDDVGRLPWLEVHVSLPAPRAHLRHDLEQALEGRAVRLIRFRSHLTGDAQGLADAHAGRDLRDLTPDEVFVRMYAQAHSDPLPDPLLHAFHDVLAAVQEGRA